MSENVNVQRNMVVELDDTSKVKSLFEGWQETLIYSCIQRVMGRIYVTDTDNPTSAFAYVGCFGFVAGEPNRELLENKPEGFAIITPQNEAWAALIEDVYPDAKRVTRYAIKKDTRFDKAALQKNIDMLPRGYEIRRIDSDIYDKCMEDPVTRDFVSSFDSKEKYLDIGRGVVILKDDRIVSGASSYTRYKEGIEIEVDTAESERRNHLATIACSALILRCLEENLYPSWDAQNMNSVQLAEKLGYEFDHEYAAYEVDRVRRPAVILRDMVFSDIEDYVRWFTLETEWMKTDSPWENEETTQEAERSSWTEYFESVRELPEVSQRWKYEIELDGKHIGWVSSYVDLEYVDNPEHIPAVGIDIPVEDARNKGVGTQALKLFLEYLKDRGYKSAYTQTWSGNHAMLRVAEKLGFTETARKKDYRVVDGKLYDAITLQIDL